MNKLQKNSEHIPILSFIASLFLSLNIEYTNIIVIMILSIVLLISVEVVVLVLLKGLLNIKDAHKIRLSLLPISLSCIVLHVIKNIIHIDQYFRGIWILVLFFYYSYLVIPFIGKILKRVN